MKNLCPCFYLILSLLISPLVLLGQVALLPNVDYEASEVIEIWPNGAPGETGNIGPEYTLPDRPRPFDQITDVSVPTLSVFLPSDAKRTGTAMLVIPGGGLQRLAIEHEGYEVAEWLNERGIAAFLLKYRVPPRDPERRWKVGLQDAQRAMGIVRQRAEEWKVDRDSLGAIGFSAGGEINVMLSIFGDERQYEPVDEADTYSTRPDFNIPIYPGGILQRGGRALREDIGSRIVDGIPPMFVVHAFDDSSQNSLVLMSALKQANVASELHIFAAGGHGFGFRDSGLPVNNWRQLCMNWLDWQGYLDEPAIRDFARSFEKARSEKSEAWPMLRSIAPQFGMKQAYAAQRRYVRASEAKGARVVGYKGAFTTEASQSSFGVDGPAFGVLFESGRLDANDSNVLAFDSPTLVEMEIGFVFGTDIGMKLSKPRQAMTAIEFVYPIVELPVHPGAMIGDKASGVDWVAANIGSDRYIVGEAVDPKSIEEFDSIETKLFRNDDLIEAAQASSVSGGQAQNLMKIINMIIDQGHVIRKGDIVLSGSLGTPVPLEAGSRYEVDFGSLGKIDFESK